MKKILFATAVMLMAVVGSSQANAELALVAANGGSFNFDPENNNGGTNFTVNGDNGLSDLAIFVGYQSASGATIAPIQLTGGTASGGVGGGGDSSVGSFTFDQISLGNGVLVDAVANFNLVDATGFSDVTHHVAYDLQLQTTGVSPANEGSLLSFVGFDFNGDATDSLQNASDFLISGFGNTTQVAVGAADRALVGDFLIAPGQGPNLIQSDNANFDTFNGPIGGDLTARFDSAFDTAPSIGDLGFGAFSNFQGRAVDQLDATSGVFGFETPGTAIIPEPSTWMMASMGLGMVAFRRRKRA